MASRSVIVLPRRRGRDRSRPFLSNAAAQPIHSSQCRGGEKIRLRAELDQLFRRARRVVDHGLVQSPLPLEIKLGAALSEQVDERPRDAGVTGWLAREQQPHRRAAVGPESRGIHVRAEIKQQPGDLDDVLRKRAKRSREPAAVGVARDVMEQRRAGEVMVRRLEVRPRMDQRWICRDQASQALKITGIERGDRVVKARVRLKFGEASRSFYVMLEPRPVLEAILPSNAPVARRPAPAA